MRIGTIIPNAGLLPRRLGLREMAEAAEGAGAQSLWVSDHVVLSKDPSADYPYSADGSITWDVRGDYFESLTTCTYLAAVTSSCEIGTAVLVLPQRNVLQTAKEMATIDVLSNGRLVVGVGSGWNRLEMEALGYSFTSRGKRMDEMILLLRDCWTGEPGGFAGEHLQIPDGLVLYPRPVSTEGPPILVGGMAAAAIRRAATIGDGWLAIGFVDRWDQDSLKLAAEKMRRETNEAEREQALRWTLKLHCSSTLINEVNAFIEKASLLGFDEVILEAPFDLGIDEAAAVIESAVAIWS